jgi:hypothetical protein
VKEKFKEDKEGMPEMGLLPWAAWATVAAVLLC